MALEKALEELLEGVRAEIIALRQVKNQIKADLSQERERMGEVMGKDWPQWVFDTVETFTTTTDAKVIERAQILADTVSYEIWGGARGWEKATDRQFEILLEKLKEKLRANTDERVGSVRREDRTDGECFPSDDGDSQPVDHHNLDEAPGDTEHVRPRNRRSDV